MSAPFEIMSPLGPAKEGFLGYLLAGLLIERVTGHTYADEIRRRVIAPLHRVDGQRASRPDDAGQTALDRRVEDPAPLAHELQRDGRHEGLGYGLRPRPRVVGSRAGGDTGHRGQLEQGAEGSLVRGLVRPARVRPRAYEVQ